MRWLVTLKGGTDPERAVERLRALGAIPTNVGPIPMDGGETVFEIEASGDVADQLAQEQDVSAVHPSSDYTLD
ncbi:MAG TPA: hypothetical protein VHK90_11025 [Thermoanaerobaculia bacterium]|nr:hypothetical protein [Thermoanaerobaculia bacterium]